MFSSYHQSLSSASEVDNTAFWTAFGWDCCSLIGLGGRSRLGHRLGYGRMNHPFRLSHFHLCCPGAVVRAGGGRFLGFVVEVDHSCMMSCCLGRWGCLHLSVVGPPWRQAAPSTAIIYQRWDFLHPSRGWPRSDRIDSEYTGHLPGPINLWKSIYASFLD